MDAARIQSALADITAEQDPTLKSIKMNSKSNMNLVLKFALALLGLLVSGFAIFKKLRIESPASAWENSLANDVRLGNVDHALATLKASGSMAGLGWNVIIVAGLLVFIAACLIRTRSGQ